MLELVFFYNFMQTYGINCIVMYCQLGVFVPLSQSFALIKESVHSILSEARIDFRLTVLLVVPLAQCVICLSSVCDVLYCGKTVRPR